ncbi:ferric/cupric-chelate reductase [Rhizophlyctis rosea]|uniref:Ferric/cupric-chelate reductase n=1 Tax=Rhizophlyctis rosea TaxID=64517 RepID=A0AAD5SAE1_9FUNG|nr:ferric/cupric-chelate reductase [Rhizophlyctis rosea]
MQLRPFSSPSAQAATWALLVFVPLGLIFSYAMLYMPCYADFCIEHVHKIARDSSQIALAVFWLWVISVAVVMFQSTRSPALHKWLHTPWRKTSYTNGEFWLIASITAVFLLNTIFYIIRVEYLLQSPAYARRNLHPSRRKAFFWAMWTGKLTDVSLGMLFLLSAKNNGFQTLFGVRYERMVRVHRGVGWFFMGAVFFHTLLYLIYTKGWRTWEDLLWSHFTGGQKPGATMSGHGEHAPGWGQGNWLNTMGAYCDILLIPILLFSLPWVRRRFFTLFYAVHMLAIPAAIFAFLHAASDFYYCIPGLGMYAVDLIIRLNRLRQPNKVLSVTEEPAGFLRFDIDMPEDWKKGKEEVSGMWMFVNVRGISRLQWHPYSLAQAPSSDVLTVMFKPNFEKGTEFEAQFAKLLLSKDAETLSSVKIAIDGPLGGLTFDPQDVDTLLCFAAGTGITPALGILRKAIAARVMKGREVKVCLFWSVRDEGAEGCSILQEILAESQGAVHLEVFHTGAASDSDSEQVLDTVEVPASFGEKAKIAKLESAHTLNNTVTNSVVVTRRRMDPAGLLTTHVSASSGAASPHKLGVFVCGAPAFVDSTRKHITAFTEVTRGAVDVMLHEEGFEM